MVFYPFDSILHASTKVDQRKDNGNAGSTKADASGDQVWTSTDTIWHEKIFGRIEKSIFERVPFVIVHSLNSRFWHFETNFERSFWLRISCTKKINWRSICHKSIRKGARSAQEAGESTHIVYRWWGLTSSDSYRFATSKQKEISWWMLRALLWSNYSGLFRHGVWHGANCVCSI